MVSLDSIYGAADREYCNTVPVNIYDSPDCEALATQAIAHRHLTIRPIERPDTSRSAIPVVLIEDHYPGWLKIEDLNLLQVAKAPYYPKRVNRSTIESCLPDIIDYAKQAMAVTNEYLWGGTIGPNLDCSGLVQRAYGSQGIWLPRDAYQQEAFVQAIPVSLESPCNLDEQLRPGDLIFFGPPQKATHVAIYLGEGRYIHSSGQDKGRNGIGIDHLLDTTHPVSQHYAQEFRGAGRVMTSYCP